ncbi:MAG: hypothetical protein II290_06040, partial [Oscillospiraceae bacterium]|nr:hypothetical protein [Oscillospiraceae bacterium]
MNRSRLNGWLLGGILGIGLSVALLLLLCFSPMASAAGTEGLITIELSDSYGDGWSDNAIEVYGDGELIGVATMDDGASAVWTTAHDRHVAYEFRWVNGVYPQETSFVIYVGTEQKVSASGYDYGGGAIILSVDKTCSAPTYSGGVCKNCGTPCPHRLVGKNGACADCGFICPGHQWTAGVCSVCSGTCLHASYSAGACDVCGQKTVLSIEMEDAFSDGWMDNAIEVYADGVLLETVTIDSGMSGSWSTEYVTTATYTFKWVAGTYAEECSFRILLNDKVCYEATNDDCGALPAGLFYTLEPWCDHTFDSNYLCVNCGKTCTHSGIGPKGTCGICGFTCGTSAAHVWSDDGCQVCGLVCAHESWNDSVCNNCGFICGTDAMHSFDAAHACTRCDFVCGTTTAHAWENGICTVCGGACAHESWTGFVCNACGLICGTDAPHSFDAAHGCSICGFICGTTAEHAWEKGTCTVCGLVCDHQVYNNGVCAGCGDYQPAIQNGVGENGYALYEIHNAGQLLWFADYVNSAQVLSTKVITDAQTGESFFFEYTSGCVNGKLVADIDMSGLTWTPIGRPHISLFNSRNAYGYAGVFDGNGHTVSGIDCTVRSDDGAAYVGFFGAIGGGTVKHLTVKGNIEGIIGATSFPAAYVGGISGYVCEWFDYTGTSTDTRQDVFSSIVGCTFIGSVSVDAADQEYVGGIAGMVSGTNITNCLSAATVDVAGIGSSFAGSICGHEINDCIITNCWFDSTLCTLGEVNGGDHAQITGLSTDRMAMGGVAHALGFGQTLGTDPYPSYGDDPVYQVTSGCCTYSNAKPATVTGKAHVGASCIGQTVCSDCGVVFQAPGHVYVNGICTACGAADPDYDAVVDPGLVLNYPTLSFEDEIIYNVYFSVKDMTSVKELGLMVLSKMDQNATIDDAVALVPGYVTNGTVFLAKSEGIPAANMGDTLYFKVYAKLSDGSYAYSSAGGYNAKAYANSILNGNNSEEMKALVVSMLNYGAEAQLYFGHNTGALVNNALTAEQKALVKAYDSTMMDAIVKADSSKTTNFVRVNSNFSQLYPSVSFDGAFAINFYCAPAVKVDDGMTLYYWDMETMASVDKLTVENATGSMEMTDTNGMWWGQVAGIAAKEMDKTYYVSCVFESNGETITTGVIPYSLG